MDTYRQEIIESQKTRADLLKWKLILNAVLGGIGLGLRGVGLRGMSGDGNISGSWVSSHIYLILCLIPFICAYVDLLCYHLDLRVFVIASFLKSSRRKIIKNSGDNSHQGSGSIEYKNYQLYEIICEEERDAFSLESFALNSSSIFLSIILIVLPVFIELDSQSSEVDDFALVLSGIIGITLSMLIKGEYEKKCEFLGRLKQKDKSIESFMFANATSSDIFNKIKNIYKKIHRKIFPNFKNEEENKIRLSGLVNWRFTTNLKFLKFFTSLSLTLSSIFIYSIVFFSFFNYLEIKKLSLANKKFPDVGIDDRLRTCIDYDSQAIEVMFWLLCVLFIVLCISLFLARNLNSKLEEYKKINNKDLKKREQYFSMKCYSFLLDNSLISEKESFFKGFILSLWIYIILLSIVVFFSAIEIFSIEINHIGFEQKWLSLSISRPIHLLDKLVSFFLSFLHRQYLDEVALTLGIFELAVMLFIPFAYFFAFEKVNSLSNFQTILPKEVGQIQSHFIGLGNGCHKKTIIFNDSNSGLLLNMENNNDGFSCAEPTEKCKLLIDSQQNSFSQPCFSEGYLHLLKCTNGIVIVNPNNDFIAKDKAIINISNSNKRNTPKTGIFWEAGFNFSVRLDSSSSTKDSTTAKLEFSRWDDKISPEGKQSKNGLEIGDETVLCFVYLANYGH